MVLNFQIIRQALLVLQFGSCEIYCEIEISSDSWVIPSLRQTKLLVKAGENKSWMRPPVFCDYVAGPPTRTETTDSPRKTVANILKSE